MLGLTVSSTNNQSVGPVVSPSDLHPLYQTQSQEASLDLNNQFAKIIALLKADIEIYYTNFQEAFVNYVNSNSNLRKMANTLNLTSRSQRSEKVQLTEGDYNNKQEKYTQELIQIMKEGHSLLLRIRSQLTGQNITTKFIIKFNDQFYEVDEDSIPLDYTLSQYGGGTVSNPFSLAYEISADMLTNAKLLKDDNNISTSDIWSKINEVKPGYLKLKEAYWKAQGQDRVYKNIYFDSKDAEIYERYRSQRGQGLANLTPQKYFDLRAEIGRSHTPFYKSGDIGLTQMKFVNLDKSKTATINFTRLSLLRDRLQQLLNIFSNSSLELMKNQLINFFTEKESPYMDKVTLVTNSEAKKMIEKLFINLT